MTAKVKFIKPIREEIPNVPNVAKSAAEKSSNPLGIVPEIPDLDENELEIVVNGKNGLVESITAPKTRGQTKDKIVPLDVKPSTAIPPIEKKAPGNGGRNSTSKNKAGNSPNLLSVEKISRQIYGGHQLLNTFVKGTDISQDQADLLAEAVKDVIEEFGFTINPKLAAIVNLVTVVAIVEFPVMLKVRQTVQQSRAAEQARLAAMQQANVRKSQQIEVGQAPDTQQPVTIPNTILLNAQLGSEEVVSGEPLKS